MDLEIEFFVDEEAWVMFLTDAHRRKMHDVFMEVVSAHEFLSCAKKIVVSMMFTDDDSIKELNNRFRNKNEPTNVLSFPDIEDLTKNMVVDQEVFLGDIAMSFDVIASEAASKNITFQDHFTHLVVHSLLHLLGHDHKKDEDALVMENKEIAILSKFGIKSPY